MITTTRLRIIRLKYGISLFELEKHCSFSNQYLSMLELGKVKRTENKERILGAALDALIRSRRESLAGLEQTLNAHRGHLLETLEAEADEF